MVDALTGVTEIASNTNANVINLIQSYLQQESMLLPTVSNFSSLVKKGDKSIALPYLGGLTVGDKTENTAVSAQALTYGKSTLALNKHKVVQWLLEKIASNQAVTDMEADYLLRATKDLARQIDQDLIVQLKAASASAPDHQIVFIDTATDVIARGDILAARKLLQAQFVNDKELYMGVSSEKEAELLNISDFIDASKYGSNAPIMNGEIGRIYGIKVIRHEDFADFMCMWHPTSVGYAAQVGPDFDMQKDLANLGMRYSLDVIYGCQVLDSGKRNVFVDSTNA